MKPLSPNHSGSAWEVFTVFLRLGFVAFGGPAAHVGLMEDEFVRRRRWLSHEQFLDLMGVVNLIPGPNSTEMAIHIGYLRAGWRGLLLAGLGFILPAAVLVTLIAWAYQQFAALPQVSGPLYGVKPVIIAVIVQALWGVGRKALKTRLLVVLGAAVAAAALLGADPLVAMLLGGLLLGLRQGAVFDRSRSWRAMLVMTVLVAGILAIDRLTPGAQFLSGTEFGLIPLFAYFLKLGSVLYGTGYVLLAFLEADLVEQLGWINSRQLLDATAVGQVTPGPLFTTATFIGYLKAGVPGAVVATVGIFLPSFVLIAAGGFLFPRLRQSAVMGAFLDGVNVAAVALMGVVTLRLVREAVVDPLTLALAVVSGLLLLRFRVNTVWLVLGGAAIGWAVYALGWGG